MDGRIVSRLWNDHSVPKTEVRTYLNTHSTHSLRDESDTDIPSPKPKKAKSKPLDKAVRAAMKRSEKDLQCKLGFFHCPEKADFQDRVTITIMSSPLTTHWKVTASFSFKMQVIPLP